MSEPVIVAKGIGKSFSGVKVLRDADLEIYPGEVLALVGENGAGKSTLMKILSGIHEPTTGHLERDSRTIEIRNPRDARSLGISIVHQELNLVPNRTVAQNVLLAAEPRVAGAMRITGLIDRTQLADEASRRLERVGAGTVPLHVRVSELPSAQQQLVEIARSLEPHVQVLLLDEPTSSLAGDKVAQLLGLIKELRSQGVGVVFTTHRLPEAFEVADRFVIMRDGRIVADENAAELDPDAVIRHMVGRSVANVYPSRSGEPRETVLSVRGLSGGMVRDASFELRSGEVLGFGGLIGAGRTETMRLLFGIDPVESGDIRINGNRKHFKHPREAVANGIGFVPEDRKNQSIIALLSVEKNMLLAALGAVTSAGFIRLVSARRLAAGFASRMRIKMSSPRQAIKFLSGGNQQKAVLAKWLLLKPRILILDEPTRGIDVGAKAEIYELINELRESGVAIIMVSSELPELLGMSDRVCVMAGGRVRATMDGNEANPENVMKFASMATEIYDASTQEVSR